MADHFKDPEGIIWISVPLDADTAAMLETLSNECHADPVKVASSLLHDVLRDDSDAHFLISAPAASPSYN